MSTRSLAPAASTVGCVGSTASDGSFTAFCGWLFVGLATLTRASTATAFAAGRPADKVHSIVAAAAISRNPRSLHPLIDFSFSPPSLDGDGLVRAVGWWPGAEGRG